MGLDTRDGIFLPYSNIMGYIKCPKIPTVKINVFVFGMYISIPKTTSDSFNSFGVQINVGLDTKNGIFFSKNVRSIN